MVFVALGGVGVLVGLLAGRWWVAALAIAFGVWIYKTGTPTLFVGTDLSRSQVAVISAVWVGVGVLVGVVIRRALRRSAHPS